MAASVEKLRDSLESIPGLGKTTLSKEIASVVRFSQGTTRASWKTEKQPNWWRDGHDVSLDGDTFIVPKFQAVKQLAADGIKAALCMFYRSRIHFEEHVRESASDAILSESFDGKNPYPPEHYRSTGGEEQDAPHQDDQSDDVMADVQSVEDDDEGQQEDEDKVNIPKETLDESERVKPKTKQRTVSEADESEDNDDDSLDADEFDIDALDALVAKLRLGDPQKFVDTMRVKLKQIIEAEATSDSWTPENEKYKLMVAFHGCTAKLMFDTSALRTAVEEKSEDDAVALQDKCEKSLNKFTEMLLDPEESSKPDDDNEILNEARNGKEIDAADEDNDEGENAEVVEVHETPDARASSRRPRRPPAAATNYTTPVSDASRDRRAAAASRALKSGTPSREPKENEELYDANGNRVDVLFSSKGSPIYISQTTTKTRRARKARLPPTAQTTSTSTTGNVRRSKRNKP